MLWNVLNNPYVVAHFLTYLTKFQLLWRTPRHVYFTAGSNLLRRNISSAFNQFLKGFSISSSVAISLLLYYLFIGMCIINARKMNQNSYPLTFHPNKFNRNKALVLTSIAKWVRSDFRTGDSNQSYEILDFVLITILSSLSECVKVS